jgi:phosphohistidine phosphatase SixA
VKYLARHAEKTDSSVHAELSKQGKLDSINYGKKLLKNNTNIAQIITSPIKRCVQTSELIAIGLSKNIPIIHATELGNPGIYISDDQKVMDIFNKYTLLEIMNTQLSIPI